MLTTALINTLGVATWYIMGIAYVSTASRLWPHKEEFRGKWTPWDIRDHFAENPPPGTYRDLPTELQTFVIVMAFLMFLTIWPVSVYSHAKRGFRTERGNHAE